MSKRCERTSEQKSEWPRTLRVDFVVILTIDSLNSVFFASFAYSATGRDRESNHEKGKTKEKISGTAPLLIVQTINAHITLHSRSDPCSMKMGENGG